METGIKGARVLVTGASGFLGRHLVGRIEEEKPRDLITFTSREYDLTKPEGCRRLFSDNKNIDVVFHLACDVGGIRYNLSNPAKILYNNTMMNAMVLDLSWRSGAKKFIGIGSICEYPKSPKIPFREDDLWNGYPEESNGAYAMSKRQLLAQTQAYSSQYGFNAIHPLLANMYGPGDNFDIDSGHVIPGIIRKMVEAKKTGGDVTLWGDGSPSRDFLYVADAAEAIVLAAKRYSKPDPVNVGSGRETKIKELAETIAKIVGFKGRIVWDATKPGGQQRRLLDISKAKTEFGFEARTTLEDGLRRTIDFYMKHGA
jgi:GDP-L-fucose synthase